MGSFTPSKKSYGPPFTRPCTTSSTRPSVESLVRIGESGPIERGSRMTTSNFLGIEPTPATTRPTNGWHKGEALA